MHQNHSKANIKLRLLQEQSNMRSNTINSSVWSIWASKNLCNTFSSTQLIVVTGRNNPDQEFNMQWQERTLDLTCWLTQYDTQEHAHTNIKAATWPHEPQTKVLNCFETTRVSPPHAGSPHATTWAWHHSPYHPDDPGNPLKMAKYPNSFKNVYHVLFTSLQVCSSCCSSCIVTDCTMMHQQSHMALSWASRGSICLDCSKGPCCMGYLGSHMVTLSTLGCAHCSSAFPDQQVAFESAQGSTTHKHHQTSTNKKWISLSLWLIRDRVSELTPAFSSCATLDDFPPDVGSPQVTTEPSTSQNSQSPSWVDQQSISQRGERFFAKSRMGVLCQSVCDHMRPTLPRHFASLPSLLQMLHQYRLQQPHQPKDHHSPRHYCRRPWYSMAQRNSAKTKSETLGLSKLSCNLSSCAFSPPRCIISKKESAVAAQFQKCTGCSTNKCDHVELILHCSGISSPICISPGHHRSILGAALDSLATTCKKCYGAKRASPSLFLSLSLHPCLNLFISLLFSLFIPLSPIQALQSSILMKITICMNLRIVCPGAAFVAAKAPYVLQSWKTRFLILLQHWVALGYHSKEKDMKERCERSTCVPVHFQTPSEMLLLATVDESPPQDGSPQVTTEPSSFLRYKAPYLSRRWAFPGHDKFNSLSLSLHRHPGGSLALSSSDIWWHTHTHTHIIYIYMYILCTYLFIVI